MAEILAFPDRKRAIAITAAEITTALSWEASASPYGVTPLRDIREDGGETMVAVREDDNVPYLSVGFAAPDGPDPVATHHVVKEGDHARAWLVRAVESDARVAAFPTLRAALEAIYPTAT